MSADLKWNSALPLDHEGEVLAGDVWGYERGPFDWEQRGRWHTFTILSCAPKLRFRWNGSGAVGGWSSATFLNRFKLLYREGKKEPEDHEIPHYGFRE